MTKLTAPFRSSANTPNMSHMLPTQRIYVFVWISEQAAIISLYNINSLVLITGTECVYCALRTLPLSVSLVFSVLTHMVTTISWLQEHTTFLFLLFRRLFWTVKYIKSLLRSRIWDIRVYRVSLRTTHKIQIGKIRVCRVSLRTTHKIQIGIIRVYRVSLRTTHKIQIGRITSTAGS
jgi:hypothetical protein